MFSFLDPIKGYIAIAATAIMGILFAVFKHRGNKIEELEAVVSSKDKEIIVAAKVVESERDAAQYVADNRVAAVKAEEVEDEDNHKYAPDSQFYI